jgi:hypothetical protein
MMSGRKKMGRVRHSFMALVSIGSLSLAGGCDELAVDPPALPEADVLIACREGVPAPELPGGSFCRMMVGEIDTLRLTLLLDSVPVTGLRLSWFSDDTTGLLIRNGLEFVDSATLVSLTPEEFLGLTRQAQLIARRRGSYEVSFAIDSIGFETTSFETPFVVNVTERWSRVTAGRHHTCALTYTDLDSDYDSVGTSLRRGGEAFCWGDGLDGGLGTGGFNETTPTDVLTDERFFEIEAGEEHTCAVVTANGFMYCWGGNEWGQLGTGNALDQFAPRLLALGIPFDEPSVGGLFSCGVPKSFGSELTIISSTCWGRNVEGQLGCDDGDPDSPCLDQGPGNKGNLLVPSEDVVSVNGDIFFSTVSAGARHACGIEEGLSMQFAWCWGDNSFGQLGATTNDCVGNTAADTFPCSRLAVPVQGPGGGQALTFQSISAGDDFTCGITSFDVGAQVYCWGRNDSGQLGDGTNTDSDTPVQLAGAAAGPFIAVSAGGKHACAVDLQLAAYCWGANSNGQLGDSSTVSSSLPVAVTGGFEFLTLSAGDSHTCGVVNQPVEIRADTASANLASGGPIYCWGDNEPSGMETLGGKLGNGTRVSSPSPVRISEPFF